MSTTNTSSLDSPGLDCYLALILKFPLRHLRSDGELTEAILMIDSLIGRGNLETGEQDYLDVLTDIVEKYEADEHPMPKVSDSVMLRHLLDARDMTQTALAKEMGVSDSIISEVLNGKRMLTRSQVQAAAEFFGVNMTLFGGGN